MKVLITGGAGFIGSHLADRVLDLGGEDFPHCVNTSLSSRSSGGKGYSKISTGGIFGSSIARVIWATRSTGRRSHGSLPTRPSAACSAEATCQRNPTSIA